MCVIQGCLPRISRVCNYRIRKAQDCVCCGWELSLSEYATFSPNKPNPNRGKPAKTNVQTPTLKTLNYHPAALQCKCCHFRPAGSCGAARPVRGMDKGRKLPLSFSCCQWHRKLLVCLTFTLQKF